VKRRRTKKQGSGRLDSLAWIQAGREALIDRGIAAVRISPIALTLGVTTGSFYWHFSSLPEFLDALLADWEATNNAPFYEAINAHPNNGAKQYVALVNVWIEEKKYIPRWDAAVRDWARASPKVEAAVRRTDEVRIKLLHAVFLLLGYTEPEALVRARISYFHQVGYYALHIVESRSERMRLLPYYIRILQGTADP
jgi:AcrR family transcriptional regulator